MKKNSRKFIGLLFLLLSGITCNIVTAGNVKNEMLLDSAALSINFDQAGAAYHVNEAGIATIKINQPDCQKVFVEVVDVDQKTVVKSKSFTRKGSDFLISYPFRLKKLGYYYIKVSIKNSSDKTSKYFEEGFGVIPNVTLTAKDWDSPFGVCGHYQRYKDWRIGDVQKKLGIAWVRDEAEWSRIVKSGVKSDPYLDYLDSKNICWLALFDYVNSYNGVLGADSIWHFDKDVSMVKKYVEMHKGHFQVYESQNEPNNFGGWSKRWPHPKGQQWRPQGWGKPFTDLIKQMHDSIHAVDSTIKLMWPGDEEWISYFVKERDAAPYMDITSIHPYVNEKRYPETDLFANGGYTEHKKLLKEMKVPTDMWVTEVGWSTYLNNGKPNRYPSVTEVEQASYLVRTYLLHLYHGASKVFWYEMMNEPFGENNPESFFGIIRFNKSLTVKPSAVAFANMVNNYRYAVPVGKYAGSEGMLGFAYKVKESKPQLCLWREKDSVEEILKLNNSKKIQIIDIFGRVTTLKVNGGIVKIQVGISPITIVGIDETDFKNLYKSKTVE